MIVMDTMRHHLLDFPQDRSADAHDCGARLSDNSKSTDTRLDDDANSADVLTPIGRSGSQQTVHSNDKLFGDVLSSRKKGNTPK